MRDNRDPQALGNYLLHLQELHPGTPLTQLYDKHAEAVMFRMGGESERGFERRVREWFDQNSITQPTETIQNGRDPN